MAWITPGSLFAAIAWLMLTIAFGFYVTHFTNYEASYGSLGAVVALLTWMYLSAYAFVFGAELNSEIEHQTAIDSTTGQPVPMGSAAPGRPTMSRPTTRCRTGPRRRGKGRSSPRPAPKVADEKG